MNKPTFRSLSQPGWIGKMSLRNRIVMPAMATEFSTQEGYITERLKDYYEARAKGGAGLIIVEATSVE
ncbi:MAG: hypothetical protein PHQ86_08295, partial [Dehalococcoidales bacterium]|nr:hypothetical protein [Dehalococcoidales bacterium]